jgi:endonuclease/exonuclease/phosphatase (EEP) superfamily protein YafD
MRRIELLAMVMAALSLGASVLATSAPSWWVGDLAVNFRLQYVAAALVALIVLGWARRWSWAAAAVIAIVLDVIAAAPVFDSAASAARIASTAPLASAAVQGVMRSAGASVIPRQPLRIASINVLYHNTHYDRVIAFLRDARPDAAVLVEITPRWRDALSMLDAQYPYRLYARGPHNGTLLLSRWPVDHAERVAMGPHADPTVTAALSIHGRILHLIGVHPAWPLGPAVSAERNRELGRLAALARATPAPLVMAGDFNTTPFSPHFGAFLRESGLRWAAQGAGWQPTWPTFLPPGGIQIDHAFVSPDLQVERFARGPGIGSDHRPILIDLEW